jgi:glycosyltransferase involved in cell wall biosynthesis
MATSGDAEEWERRLHELERGLAQLRELTRRAYEGTPRFTQQLLELRRSDGYDAPFGQNPLITVRIGAYGSPDELCGRALASVLGQTYPHWEAVVVCDGPAPETQARVEALGDARLRCFQRPRNGPYPQTSPARWMVAGVHPFNEGVALARGAWIAPMDQDDAWSPHHLEVLLERARRTRAELVYGATRVVVDGVGETYFGRWPPELGDFGFQAAMYHAGLSGFLYDVNAYLSDEPADWNLARRMLEAGVRADFADTIVGTYYVDPTDAAFGWWSERVADRGPYASGSTT